MKDKHTPTPWVTYQNPNELGDIRIYADKVEGVPTVCKMWLMPESTALANAEYIVKCVNLHEELVEALKMAKHLIESPNRGQDKERCLNIIKRLIEEG